MGEHQAAAGLSRGTRERRWVRLAADWNVARDGKAGAKAGEVGGVEGDWAAGRTIAARTKAGAESSLIHQ
ncbi:hypothetical protein [Sphingomonas bacterium]|uniref:hypothetical protein n=1 Tax=Sphingomonas bacterium TaxID=1895847 RepID=UPI00345C5C86